MCTKSALQIILDKIVSVYREEYANDLVSIILYGSYARGDYTAESDIDLVAIVRGKRIDLQSKLDSIWDATTEIGLGYDVIISPTVIPYDEFEENKEVIPYYRNIDKEGVRIVA